MTPYANPPKPLSDAWVRRVANLLRDGYGAEDIALLLSSPPEKVRTMIKLFREAGHFAKWWPSARVTE